MRKKSGRGSSVSVIKCRVKSLTFSVNALPDDFPAQCGWGRRTAVAAKIAVSESPLAPSGMEISSQVSDRLNQFVQ
jgi:hypothetical protein